jgi:hypothetical protein
MAAIRNGYKILAGSLMGRDDLEELGIDGWAILNLI